MQSLKKFVKNVNKGKCVRRMGPLSNTARELSCMCSPDVVYYILGTIVVYRSSFPK